MTRSELYRRVWETSMRTLAPEFGMSDVALGKLCRSLNIPTPGVGYWARAAAGQSAPKRPLPVGEDVAFRMPEPVPAPTADRRTTYERAYAAVRKRAAAETPMPVAEMRDTLDGAPAIVLQTRKWFEDLAKAERRLEEERAQHMRQGGKGRWRPFFPDTVLPEKWCGRYRVDTKGALRLDATPARLDWILRFHDALIRALEGVGCHVSAVVGAGCWMEVAERGQSVKVAFAEDFEKLRDGEYRAAKTFRLKLGRRGTVFRNWRQTPEQFERELPAIVQAIQVTIRAQEEQAVLTAEFNRAEQVDRDAADALRRVQYVAEQAERRRAEARAAQTARAVKLADAQLRHEATMRVLADLADQAESGAGGDGIRVWLALAYAGLRSPAEDLAKELRRELANAGRPDWWPEGEP